MKPGDPYRYDLLDKYPLTPQEMKLLGQLVERPRHIVDYFRPLHALIKHGLVQPHQIGAGRSGMHYGPSEVGALLFEADRMLKARREEGIPDDVCYACKGNGIRDSSCDSCRACNGTGNRVTI